MPLAVDPGNIDRQPPRELDQELADLLIRNFEIIKTLLEQHVAILEPGTGVSDTFTTTDGKTVTVVDGVITSIV